MNTIKHVIEKDANTSLVCGAGLTVNLFDYFVPQKGKMILTFFSNYLNLAGHWGAVTWVISRNGVPINNYEAIQDQIGLQSRPRKIQRLVFHGGDRCLITATDDNTIAQPPVLETGIAIRYEEIEQ